MSRKKPKSVQKPGIRGKVPSSSKTPSEQDQKAPRSAALQESSKLKPSWAFQHFQRDGHWGWPADSGEIYWEILSKLQGFETMSWAQIEASGSHNVDFGKLCKRARERLSELNLDDLDHLFSLRLSGKQRIWGIRQGATLKVLWWDPLHQVCPSNKKHT